MTTPDITQAIASTAAEQAVLATLLQANEAFDHVAPILAPADFYSGDHQAVYRAIAALIESGKPADAITVAQWLKDRNELDRLGGMAFLVELQASMGSASSVLHYARDVREQATRRAIFQVSMKLGDMASHPDGRDSRKMLDEAQAMLAAVDERSQRGRGTFRELREVFTELLTTLDDAKNANQSAGITTGFAGLDRMVNPFMPGQLIIVGARPAVGKTSLAVNMALHACTHHKAAVGMFSMEMTDIELAIRILAGYSQVAAGRFREHRLGEKEWERINNTLATYNDAPFHIDQAGGLSIQELSARARVAAKKIGGFKMLIVDYVQLSRSEGKYDNRSVEIGAVTSGLKRLAKELQCPVVGLSQLNRDQTKDNRRPVISDLRDSGSIEADADTVLLLHRPYVASQRPEQEFDAEVIVGKQRNGQIGVCELDYDAKLTRFFDKDAAPGRARANAGQYRDVRG